MIDIRKITDVVLPCPFCGKKPEGKFTNRNGSFQIHLSCKRCGVNMFRSVIGNTLDILTSEIVDIVNTWNGEKNEYEDRR